MNGLSNNVAPRPVNGKKVDIMGDVEYYQVISKKVEVLRVDKNDSESFTKFLGISRCWDTEDNVGHVPVGEGVGFYYVEHGDIVIKHWDGSFEVFDDEELFNLVYERV